ncbi:MAG: prolipoprotein diacylglyceryl transferase [Prevotellaceae bacterium]|jgi:prolipoprotein diacylglyceryl transferase|nr:prolipoprotein diacylglyceryl transferase [Prevotellaceae bacterium]
MGNFLSVYWDVNPEIVAIGPTHLRYYAILMVGGFIAAYVLVRRMFRREQLSQELFESFAIAVIISTLIGMRLGHCLFYQPEIFIESPLEVLLPVRFSPRFEFIGYQGLASHGGAIGILLGVWWWCRKHKRSYMWATERVIIAVPLVGTLIRLGNLMNSEVYGTTTDLPWGFIFVLRNETVPHHPTQLYEALSYFVIFLIMWGLYNRRFAKMKRGTAFGLFLILLFGVRFAIEFIKEPQVDFETSMALNMGQLLSLPFIIAGIVLLWWSRKYGKPAMDTGAPVQGTAHKGRSKKVNRAKGTK